jgi:hypothetical protein
VEVKIITKAKKMLKGKDGLIVLNPNYDHVIFFQN